MASIRKLGCTNRNLYRCIRRYISTTGSSPGAAKKGSKAGNRKDSDQKDNKKAIQVSWYDTRKYSHNLPSNNVRPPFETLPNIPTGVFRCTDGEVIGPLAGKCAYYRNPEYYSFHHMSFFDLHMAMVPFRNPQINTGRKP